jgi:hypothetical protein
MLPPSRATLNEGNQEIKMSKSTNFDDQAREKWLAIRKQVGLEINPDTAEVMWAYAETFDPDGIDPELSEDYQIGREYFARAPGSEVWVWFGDLPDTTREALWQKHRSKLAFPAGIAGVLEW